MENDIYYKTSTINFTKRDGCIVNVHVVYGGSVNGVDYIYDADVSSIDGAINFIDDLTAGLFDSDDLDDSCNKYENAYEQACNY